MMIVPIVPLVALFAFGSPAFGSPESPSPEARFESWTGARLVFTRDDAPSEVLYATTPELSWERRRQAAEILEREARHYPRHLFRKIGLHTIAVFDGCGDPHGDGFRPWIESLGGYRYFGRWDAVGAIAACYYDDGQLPLTFHHEVFHHLDATRNHKLDYRYFTMDDRRFREAVDGTRRYRPITIGAEARQTLVALSTGKVLEDAVGRYASKSAGEDQAETARWLQSNLADGLLQAADRPELAGSQRILHLLEVYRSASPSLSVDWWVAVAVSAAERLEAQRRPGRVPRDEPARPRISNAYLDKVDAALNDEETIAHIRRVQPATVRIGGGSGVNLRRDGLILTNAHVADEVGDTFRVQFPDGQVFRGTTVAASKHFDLALVRLEGARDLPVASLARTAPVVGQRVVVIGQPGTKTPRGEATNYEPWHVSVGTIRGFLPDILGSQRLGRTKHSAWTYWGHSGSPLFDVRGRIVALHNSWDSKTAMRHAVPWEAIESFLTRHRELVAGR